MKSWIHELSESYVRERVSVRRDLKENYVSLTEEQRFSLLSENVLFYLDEQLQNAYGFGIYDLNEEELDIILEKVFKSATEVEIGSREAGRPREFFQTFVRRNSGSDSSDALRQPVQGSLTGAGNTLDAGTQRTRRLARREQLGQALKASGDAEQAKRGRDAIEGVRATRTREEGMAVQDAASRQGSIGDQLTMHLGPKRRGPLGLGGANPSRGGRADRVVDLATQAASKIRQKGAGRKMSEREALGRVGQAWSQAQMPTED